MELIIKTKLVFMWNLFYETNNDKYAVALEKNTLKTKYTKKRQFNYRKIYIIKVYPFNFLNLIFFMS